MHKQLTKICVITGRCGVGKDTVIYKLERDFGFERLASCTTRPRRNGENGNYHFLSEEGLFEIKAQNRLLDFIEIGGYHYGLSLDELDKANGRIMVVNLIVESGLELKKLFPRAILFHLTEDEKEIERRLIERDGKEKAEKKLRDDPSEFRACHFQDFELTNEDSQKTAKMINSIMRGKKQ